MRHAAKSREIAELAVRYRDDGVGRVRHRRRRGGLPAHPPPRRVRVPAPRERPLHHPRRRGVRAAEHLGGDPVVRRRPARATACGSSTTSPSRDAVPDGRTAAGADAGDVRARSASRPTSATAGSRWRCAPAATSRPAPPSPIAAAPDLAARAAAVPGHAQHRQPADERHVAVPRDAGCSSARRAGPSPTCGGSTINAMKSAFLPFDQRLALIDEVIKPGLRRPAGGRQPLRGCRRRVQRPAARWLQSGRRAAEGRRAAPGPAAAASRYSRSMSRRRRSATTAASTTSGWLAGRAAAG